MASFKKVPKPDEDVDYVQQVIDTVSNPEVMIALGVLALVVVFGLVRMAWNSRRNDIDPEVYEEIGRGR